MGLDVYLEEGEDLPLDEVKDEVNENTPEEGEDDHLFTKDYLRSSYNSSGFDRVVETLTSKEGLWYIFAPCGDLESGHASPSTKQLELARERAVEVYEALQTVEPVYVNFEGFNPYRKEAEKTKIRTPREALDLYQETMGKDKQSIFGGSGFRNADGSFWTEPLKVRAAIPGVGPLQEKGVWLVYDIDDLDWYIEGAKRVIDFIDTALAMKSPQIIWSY